MESRLTLSNHELSYLHHGFGPRFGRVQRVELVFCSDRSNPSWRNGPANEVGFLWKHSFVDGIIADATVYVLAYPTDTRRAVGRIQTTSTSIGNAKENVLRGLMHELIHVQQAWLHDPDFDKVYAAKDPYSKNVFEHQAYREAEAWINRNGGRVKKGDFDRYLPSWLLQKG